MKWWLLIISLVVGLGVSANSSTARVYNFLLLKDYPSAVAEAKKNLVDDPESVEAYKALIRAYAQQGNDKDMIVVWQEYSQKFTSDENDIGLLKDMSWGVIEKAAQSSLLQVRLIALLGAAMGNDVQTAGIVRRAMVSPNMVLREVAVQLTPRLWDEVLKDELKHMLTDEIGVRLAVIQAIGELHMRSMTEELKDIVADKHVYPEERAVAIEALVNMWNDVARDDLLDLAKSDKMGLRMLVCELVALLDRYEDIDIVIPLLDDNSAEVRVAAIMALGVLQHQDSLTKICSYLNDSDVYVAITAAWAVTILDPKQKGEQLLRWLNDANQKTRIYAAGALAATGDYGIDVAQKVIKENKDLFVKVNVALGLIGQRVDLSDASEIVYSFLKNNREKIMWERSDNSIFARIVPTQKRHVPMVPNYPEVVNQQVRLELFKILAIVGHPHAGAALKDFLRENTWGIVTLAAMAILQESDDNGLEVVGKLLEDEDKQTRLQAALLLAVWGHDRTAIKTLRELYDEVDREDQVKILEAIGFVGGKEEVAFLLEVFQNPSQMMRVVAAAALLQCVNN